MVHLKDKNIIIQFVLEIYIIDVVAKYNTHLTITNTYTMIHNEEIMNMNCRTNRYSVKENSISIGIAITYLSNHYRSIIFFNSEISLILQLHYRWVLIILFT